MSKGGKAAGVRSVPQSGFHGEFLPAAIEPGVRAAPARQRSDEEKPDLVGREAHLQQTMRSGQDNVRRNERRRCKGVRAS